MQCTNVSSIDAQGRRMTRQTIMLNARGPGIVDGRQVRAAAFGLARDQLLDRVLADRGLDGGDALVVGGGYSPLPAALRDRGFTTTAIDSSGEATAIARTLTSGVRFLTAPARDLPVEPGSFDLVYCADTLEVSDDREAVLNALALALRPGGTLILDTVTDTLMAKLIYLLAFQRLALTRIMPADRYSASQLQNPESLRRACELSGLDIDEVIGFEPASVGALVKTVLDRRADRITDDDLPLAAGFHLSSGAHRPIVTYFAVASKR